MNGMKKIGLGIGKVALAFLGCILMPILIWVAFGVSLVIRFREKRQMRMPMPDIADLLNNARNTIQH